MQPTLTLNRRPRRLSGAASFLAAMRQVAVNPRGSGFYDRGHVSCEELGMATQTANRRESDRVPMGVESALPWVPVPSSESPQPPKARTGVLRKLVFALLALVFLFGVWQIGKKLYIQANAPLAQAIDRKG